MIHLSVIGGVLDVPAQEISSSFASLRFADAIPEQWTTDIELPRTAHNTAILGAYGELDRGQLFGEKIPCFVATERRNSVGCLTVDKLTENTITVTVYFGNIPSELMDVKIRDLIADEAYTTVEMYSYANGHDTNERSVGKYNLWTSALAVAFTNPATQVPPYSTYGFPLPPSIRLNYLLQTIGNKIGCTMPYVNNLLYLTAKTMVGSRNVPYTRTWVVTSNGFGTLQRQCDQVGVKITNDANKITIISDQDCTLKIECRGDAGTYGNYIDVWSDNSAGVRWNGETPYTQPFYDTLAVTANVPYHIYINASFAGTFCNFVLKAYTVGQQPQDSDQHEAISLDLMGRLSDHNLAAPYIYDCYVGAIACLGDYSVKELLTALCWQFGQRVELDGSTLSFRSATVEKTLKNATLKSFEPTFDKLGRQNVLSRPDGIRRTFGIDNGLLEDKVIVQDIPLWSIYVRSNLYAPIFEWSMDEQTGDWKPSQGDFDGMVIGQLVISSDDAWLVPIGQPQWLGIDALGKVALTTWQTYEDVSECDYVYIDGHQYMLVDGTVDEESGLCEFRALEVAQPVATQGRDFSNDFSNDFS